MGNFTSNETDIVYIDVDYVSTIVGSNSSNANPFPNEMRDLEIVAGIPQFNSWDNRTKTTTYHLCLMERDLGNVQTVSYVDASSLRNPATWQSWSFKHKPSKIPVRPEVLQNKQWNIGVRAATGDGKESPDVKYLSDYTIHLSISK